MAKPRGSLSRARLSELIDRDLTVREIAAEVDRSYTTVRYWLRRFGLRTTETARRGQVRYTEGLCRRHGVTRFLATKRGPVCAACAAQRVTTWRRRAKRRLVKESGGCCQLCGYGRWVGALQFHHRDPETKGFGLGTRGLARSIEVLRAEVSKCVLLCANCHAEVEAGVATIPPQIGLSP
jgi:hypothetical protein